MKLKKQGKISDLVERKEKKQLIQKGEEQMENKTNKGKEEKRMLAQQKTGTQRIHDRCRVRRRTKRKIMS